jgi:ribosomal peptide maturation radical SAM protein 1
VYRSWRLKDGCRNARRHWEDEVCVDVLFAVMPFADIRTPAIGVSLLKAEITSEGFSSRVAYFNITLAELIGRELYGTLANGFPPESLVGEWFFADMLFEGLPDESDYFSKVLQLGARGGDQRARVLAARQQRRQFIDGCALNMSQYRPRVVAFTTTFHQTCACLAVARRLKELPSAPVVIFGGANCEGEMGLEMVQSFPWVDCVCTGEGDRAFPEFLRGLLHGGRSLLVPGIASRGDSEVTPPERVEDLDSLPIPDYTDYFERLSCSPLRPELKVDLLIETSRGCWWGAKQHCTFCGLNGNTMAFRSKSPQRVFRELATLSQTYSLKSVECVDNILNMRFIPELFERLSESELNLELFYEVKANLRYDQLAVLRAGGVRAIQPGIESFSNQVLRLMRKGCTGLQNIQLLRWCEEMDIQVGWNLLGGFPGESPSEYDRMEELIPLLTHLRPPASCCPVRLDRFSPFFAHADQYGLARVRPAKAYYYVLPLGRKALARLAYFFEFDYRDGRRPFEYMGGVARQVQRWLDAKTVENNQSPRLDADCFEGEVVITDTRAVATAPSHRLSGLEAEIYMQCDSAQSLTSLRRYFGPRTDNVCRAMAYLMDSKLMIADEEHYLSLAVFRNRTRHARIEQHHEHIPIHETPASESLLRLV